MRHMMYLDDHPIPFDWVQVPTFLPYKDRLRVYDGILDFGCWRASANVGRPVMIAGKPDEPDYHAMNMAAYALTHIGPLLDLLDVQHPDFKIPNPIMPDVEWQMHSMWVPYQALGRCWFVVFTTEYHGVEQFCFRHGDDAADVIIERWFGGSLTSNIFAVRECIASLHFKGVKDTGFTALIERIRRETIVGPELVEPLLRILDKEGLGVEESTVKHLRRLLTRTTAS